MKLMKINGIIIIVLSMALLVLCLFIGDIPEVLLKVVTIIWIIEAMKKL